jgi:molecular chaperone GrpE (heat shock protein)
MSIESPQHEFTQQSEHHNKNVEEHFTNHTKEHLTSLSDKIKETNSKIEEIQSRLARPFSIFREGKINSELDQERRHLHALEDEYRAVLGEKNSFIQ